MLDRWPYVVNLLMLVPVTAAMLLTADGGLRSVFEGKQPDAPGFRLMILGFWLAVLVGSLFGLAQPRTWAPLLVVQVIYKSVWLLAFALPAWRAGGASAVPMGIAASFLFIVCTYPFAAMRLLRA
jgi:hypothetical protein